MEEKYVTDKRFLARWASGDLNEQELSEFKKSEAYADFKRINDFAQTFNAPPIDKQKALIEIKERISFQKKSLRKKRIAYMSIAATAIVILGLFGIFNSTKTYQSTYGEQLTINLPDGSKVQLNADSQLSHQRFFWTADRKINLIGEAYFEVEKGGDFVISTDYGTVAVLGTKFNVKARTHQFEVHCFEGAVRFDAKNSSKFRILKQNDALKYQQKTITDFKFKNISKPQWTNHLSVFESSPLQIVLNELKRQYGIDFITNLKSLDKTFSGSFVHNNLEQALQTTLVPMGIDYEISKDKKIITLK